MFLSWEPYPFFLFFFSFLSLPHSFSVCLYVIIVQMYNNGNNKDHYKPRPSLGVQSSQACCFEQATRKGKKGLFHSHCPLFLHLCGLCGHHYEGRLGLHYNFELIRINFFFELRIWFLCWFQQKSVNLNLSHKNQKLNLWF